MNNKGTRLYNILFPIWMLMFFPVVWLIVLPGNFIFDSIVLLIAMAALKICERKDFYKRHILKIFAFGMLSDFIGAGFILLAAGLELYSFETELYFTIPAVIIAAAAIFLFNYFVTFRGLDAPTRMKLSLTFAIATAPYTFAIPSALIYG